MHLPSNVATYESVPLVAFDELEPIYLPMPAGATLKAWAKGHEVGRRLDHFDWLTHVVRTERGCATFISDLATAYLLSFEAAFQVLRHECRANSLKAHDFDSWLAGQPDNDLLCRGLRTMRHVEAHIGPAGIAVPFGRQIHSRFASGTDAGNTPAWHWQPLTSADYASLARPRIAPEELSVWNARLVAEPCQTLMRDGVIRLGALLISTERWLGTS